MNHNKGGGGDTLAAVEDELTLNAKILQSLKQTVAAAVAAQETPVIPSKQSPLITEEEFESMENAVNNLLISKNQIEMLNNEKNSLVKIYESKLNEQSEQIKYLKEENSQLKSIINRINANTNMNNANVAKSICSCCQQAFNAPNAAETNAVVLVDCRANIDSSEEDSWRKKYELCLDNLMRQLLNSLKIQETIRNEYLKLANNSHAGKQGNFCTSNSWTFNSPNCTNSSEADKETPQQQQTEKQIESNACGEDKFQLLLIKQQKQQLNILNELSRISKYLKLNAHLNTAASNNSSLLTTTSANGGAGCENGLEDEQTTIEAGAANEAYSPPLSSLSSTGNAHSSTTRSLSTSSSLSSNDSSMSLSHQLEHHHRHNTPHLQHQTSPDVNKNRHQLSSRNSNNNNNNSFSNSYIVCSSGSSNSNKSKPNNHSELTVDLEKPQHTETVKLERVVRAVPYTVVVKDQGTKATSTTTTTTPSANNRTPTEKVLTSAAQNLTVRVGGGETSMSNVTATTDGAQKPSKIPKLTRREAAPQASSCSSSSNSKSTSVRSNLENCSSSSMSSRVKYLSCKSKIPQRQPAHTQAMQQKPSQAPRHPPSSTNSSNTSLANKYNTYTKKKPTTATVTADSTPKTTNQQQQRPVMVNSTTFDKLKIQPLDEPAPISTDSTSNYYECKEVKLMLNNKNVIDILLVPVGAQTQTASTIGESAKGSNNFKIKFKEDEGYSTMSSELMHQIKTQAADCSSSVGSYRSSSGNNSTVSKGQPASLQQQQQPQPQQPLRIHRTNQRIKKRYCFPTLKSFSYYYNNRYYHQYHNETQQKDDEFFNANVCCKYLSDTDIAALINQLSSYDKDISYNVYHLDTLYNNVDYILFNSYASDTELVYNSNRRNMRNQHYLNSNYKLYINDYFNQPYEQEDDEEEEDDQDQDQDQEQQQDREVEAPPEVIEELDEVDDEDEEIIELDDDDGEEEDEDEDDERQMIELNVDGDENETDGLVYDDDDVNLLSLLMKTSKTDDDMNYFNINEYKRYLYSSSNNDFNVNVRSPLFSSRTSLCLNNTTSGTNDSSSASSSCSSCDSSSSSNSGDESLSESLQSLSRSVSSSCSSPMGVGGGAVLGSSSHVSSSTNLSTTAGTQSPVKMVRPRKPDVTNGQQRASRKNAHSNNASHHSKHHHQHHHRDRRHRRHRHRQHDYFINNSVQEHKNSSHLNTSGDNFYEKCDLFNASSNQINNYTSGDHDSNSKFDIDDFVTQLNMQCKMDKVIAANEKTSKHLKELNIQAAKAVVAAETATTTSTSTNPGTNTTVNNETKTTTKNLIRRHTITSMPICAAATFQYSSSKQSIKQTQNPTEDDAENASPAPVPNVDVHTLNRRRLTSVLDSKAYVGSFTLNRACTSLNSTPTRRCSFNTIHKQQQQQHQQQNATAYRLTTAPRYVPCVSNESTPAKYAMVNNEASTAHTGPTSPVLAMKTTNNYFNNDFYRLCSDTFYYGSDANLNPSTSNSSIHYHVPYTVNGQNNHNGMTLQMDTIESVVQNELHQQRNDQTTESDSTSAEQNIYQTANLTAHVNNLFDQWLLNSTNMTTTK